MRPCTQLQDLRLETDMDNRVMVDCHYGLIRKCPNLVRLYWTAEDWSPNPFSGVRMNKMAKEVEDQGSCPWKRLESLSLPGMDFKLSDFDVLINALSPTLRDLDLSWTNFDDLAWDIMYKATPSWTNLRTLNLRNCDILYGWYIHQMLCTLSGLEIFAANEFSDHDILDDDQPWICTRIRELSVGCLLFDDDTEPMMLQRFSGFTQLEVLNLSFSSTIVMDKIPGNERHLALMLDQGLDSLKTLKQLRVLELPGRDATDWSVQEAAWIKKHWPRLEKIIGKRPLYAEAYALLEYIWAVPTPSS
ncbi:hypothetical protein BGZ83_000351 [Gryganskiella cystojenkinii]|nr:hypothetical protein BGZ83_000351 [Gryganskiella cystojenkinii]